MESALWKRTTNQFGKEKKHLPIAFKLYFIANTTLKETPTLYFYKSFIGKDCSLKFVEELH